MATRGSPVLGGALTALLSAVTFGATTPLIARFGHQAGPWTTAALLYAGALAIVLPSVRSRREPGRRPARDVALRVLSAGIVGAMLAPAALAWGLHSTGALSASLVLALESVFTAALAVIVFHEVIPRRVALALTAITLGAALLVAGGGSASALGLAAVALATLLWSVDNALTGTVADADAASIVALKSAVGIGGSTAVALAVHDAAPAALDALGLLAVGAIGYGASLRWYLLAQRSFGVARTASLFAAAPFAGALVAAALGDHGPPPVLLAAAGALIALGIALHVGEGKTELHRHRTIVHEHVHRHDDATHDHTHPIPVRGAHSHPHRHGSRVHVHAHGIDGPHTHHPADEATPPG